MMPHFEYGLKCVYHALIGPFCALKAGSMSKTLGDKQGSWWQTGQLVKNADIRVTALVYIIILATILYVSVCYQTSPRPLANSLKLYGNIRHIRGCNHIYFSCYGGKGQGHHKGQDHTNQWKKIYFILHTYVMAHLEAYAQYAVEIKLYK